MRSSENETHPVHIIGAGAVTSLGATLPASAAALLSGFSSFSEHPFVIDKTGEHPIVACIPFLGEGLAGPERLMEMLLPAAEEALSPLFGIHQTPAVSIKIALPSMRPGQLLLEEEQIRSSLLEKYKGVCRINTVDTVTGSSVTGLSTIAAGWREIELGNAEFCLVGGADLYILPETLDWLDYHDRLHSRTNRWGIIPGEGAGFCLLTTAEAAAKYGLEILGTVVAVAETYDDPFDLPGRIHTGKGLSAAVEAVLASLDSKEKIDQSICDLTGEIWRADDFGFTLSKFSDRFHDPSRVMVPASAWGDTGVASAPFAVGLAVHTGLHSYATGPYTLICSSSPTGERGAILLNIPIKERR